MESALVSAVRAKGGASLEGLLNSLSSSEVLNKPTAAGVTALHVAVWRNNVGLVEKLLEAGADPNIPDHESGWSSVHSALYWGNLQVLAELLQQDGSLTLQDWKGRTPLDLASAELREYLGPGPGDVFSWGNGSNYTLGTGSMSVQLAPSRVESLHDAQVVALSAAKFHSAAVTLEGQLFTWGWGRGGRLGHPEAHIHSGESAVIAPRLVASLGKRQVLAVAAAKHHTVFCTTSGETFTMGSNRSGQLGYAVDTQPTPRRVSALRARVVAVAAANKHSVAVSAGGDVFTWGSNGLGQLGYGSSDSLSNANPRLVEAMKGKGVVAAAASKRHTVVLSAEGEVFTWGHRGVSPRRVVLAGTRDVLSSAGEQLWFHRGHRDVFRPQAVAICAGAAHSSVLTRTGVVLCWRSADPQLEVQEVGGALSGKRVVSISAGKYRTAAVTDEGDVYMWEGRSDYFPAEGRQPGSGSKKASRDRGRPIPSTGVANAQVAGSLGNGSPTPGVGSFGSYSRKGSYFDRMARDREAAQPSGLSFSARADLARPDGDSRSDVFARILPERVDGLKRAVSVSVGEKHSLALQRWSAAQLPGLQRVPWLAQPAAAADSAASEDEAYMRVADGLTTPRDLDSDASAGELLFSSHRCFGSPGRPVPRHLREPNAVGVPSLQRICEEEVARQLVDPRTALQVLEYADVAGAELLRAYCLAVAVCNLDAVLLEARGGLEDLPRHLLEELERLWKLRLGAGGELAARGAGEAAASEEGEAAAPAPAGPQDWEEEEEEARGAAAESRAEGELEGAASLQPVRCIGSRLQPGARPTAAPPSLGSDELPAGHEMLQASPSKLALLRSAEGPSSFKDKSALQSEVAAQRLLRALQRKLQQITSLEQRAAEGAALDVQQLAKVASRPVVIAALAALEGGMPVEEVQVILKAAASEKEAEQVHLSAALSSTAAASGKKSSVKGSHGSTQKGPKRGATPAKGGAATTAGPQHQQHQQQEQLARDLSGLCLASAGGPATAQGSERAPVCPAAGTPGASPSPATGPSVEGKASALFSSGAELLGSSPTATVPAFGPLGHAAGQLSPGEAATQVVGGFRGLDVAPPPSAERPKSAKSKEKGKRKGGLSMFLRGDLEKPATSPPSAPSTAPAGASPAAWGANSQAAAASTSLKDILSQEAAAAAAGPSPAPASKAAAKSTPGAAPRARPVVPAESPVHAPTGPGAGGLRLSLASFMTASNPMAIQRGGAPKPPPPAWGGVAGASPPTAAQSSFRLIQEEQQAAAAVRSFGTSPSAVHRPPAAASSLPPWRPPAGVPAGHAAAAGCSVGLLGSSPTGSSLMGTSPSSRTFNAVPAPQQSKWYVPEERSIKSLKSIQVEETAIKELSKLYGAGNVKIVPKERRSPGLPPPSARH